VKLQTGWSLLRELDFAATSDETSSSGGDETTFLSAWGISTGGCWMTNVLMVTTTVRMLDWVHGNTSNSWPVPLLGVGFVVRLVSLEERLVGSLSSGDNSDHGSAASKNGLSHSRWHSDTGLSSVFGVSDDDATGTRGTSKGATVANFSLNI